MVFTVFLFYFFSDAVAAMSGKFSPRNIIFKAFILHKTDISYISHCAFNTANPNPFTISNPDGVEAIAYLKGGEGRSWMEDTEGYTICPEILSINENVYNFFGGNANKDRKRKGKQPTYYYCTRDINGDFVPDRTREVGLVKPSMGTKIPRGRKPKTQEDRECGEFCNSRGSGRRLRARRKIRRLQQGTLKNLVVLVRFRDHDDRPLPSETDIEILMNGGVVADSLPSRSVRDYYLENSAGKLRIESTIVEWVTIKSTEEECAGGRSGLTSTFRVCVREALDRVKKLVNFADFDNDNDGEIDLITFFHSGFAAEFGGTDSFGAIEADRIWSHQASIGSYFRDGIRISDYVSVPAMWGRSGSEIGRVGVLVHETAHSLGLPDLYDYGSGAGIGYWSLMGSSWGPDGSQHFPGSLDPWSKMQLNWITPTLILESQRISIKPAYTDNDYYVVRSGFTDGSKEYLLIENRQRIGFDEKLLKVRTINTAMSRKLYSQPKSTGRTLDISYRRRCRTSSLRWIPWSEHWWSKMA